MANLKVVLNRSGVKELMKSEEMMAICQELADNALSQCGNGYEVTTRVGKTE